MKFPPSKSHKKALLITLGITVVVGVTGAVAYQRYSKKDDRPAITYSGPTEQDVKDAEDNKQKVEERKDTEAQAKDNPGSQKKQVSPQITNASQLGNEVVVNGYIAGVFEDGGTCKVVFTQGARVVSKSTNAFADATTTSCVPLRIDSGELGTGTWSVIVSYSSQSAEGASQAQSLVIQ